MRRIRASNSVRVSRAGARLDTANYAKRREIVVPASSRSTLREATYTLLIPDAAKRNAPSQSWPGWPHPTEPAQWHACLYPARRSAEVPDRHWRASTWRAPTVGSPALVEPEYQPQHRSERLCDSGRRVARRRPPWWRHAGSHAAGRKDRGTDEPLQPRAARVDRRPGR